MKRIISIVFSVFAGSVFLFSANHKAQEYFLPGPVDQNHRRIHVGRLL